MLFNSIDEGICIIEKVDTEQNEHIDFKYILINPAFEKITRLKGVIGKTFENVAKSGRSRNGLAWLVTLPHARE